MKDASREKQQSNFLSTKTISSLELRVLVNQHASLQVLFFLKQTMFSRRRIREMSCVCRIKKVLWFCHSSFHHAKSPQEARSCSKRNARNKSKIATLEKAIEASEKWRKKLDNERVKYHKLFEEKEVAKYPQPQFPLWRDVRAISISWLKLKFLRRRFYLRCFEWKSRSACWQFVRLKRDSHVLFKVRYSFHLTRYRWLCCCNICSTSYFWSSCDL